MLLACLTPLTHSAEGTTVAKPWARATAEGQQVGAIFCSISNPGTTADKLLRVESATATTVEVHEHITTKDGLMKMQAVANGIDIPTKGTVTLKPGGYHVMLIGLANRLTKGSTVKATFVFEKAGSIAVEATVLEAGAMSADEGTIDKKPAK
ncbi:MAG: copper chaperone PCu(A)C [Planctomycetota bacterium]